MTIPQQICFIVMPFDKKPTGAKDGPSEVDFNALWERALQPGIAALGYHPVRADQDLGPVIVKEMLERLVASDLVVADVTIPNANVYYEIGIRHAAKNSGCVLISANWARPLFDIQQMTRFPYPLTDGVVTDSDCGRIKAMLAEKIPQAASQNSPIKSLIPTYPDIDQTTLGVFRANLRDLSDLQTEIRTIRRLAKEEACAAALAIKTRLLSEPSPAPMAALEELYLLRDFGLWSELVDFVDSLPTRLREMEVLQEQEALAVSSAGDDPRAAALMETLIKNYGATPERLGILGGRYKRLYKNTKKSSYLDQAIDAYERGFRLDLNAYYCGSNLPRLLRERADDGDLERARVVSFVVAEACETARESGAADEWLNPTQLGLAFDKGDVALAKRCLRNIRKEGHAAWKLESTLADLERSIVQQSEPDIRGQLQDLLADMWKLLKEA